MIKNTRAVLLTFGFLIVFSFFLIHLVGRYHQMQCREQLKALGYAIQVYKDDNGSLPHQLSVLSNELSNPSLLICPGAGRSPGRFANADAWSDYTFIDWSIYLGTNTVPSDYPIAYDRHIRNHGGGGVNVLTVDGFVQWDSEAKLLKGFADEHPNLKLSIPENEP